MALSPPFSVMDTLTVMAGGAVGAALRLHMVRAIHLWAGAGWPMGTLGVNIIGSMAMGLLSGFLLRTGAADAWRLLLGVGVLGGFTTFSAFSLDMMHMLQSGRWVDATAYAGASVIGSVAALAAGFALTRLF
ncbi:MAG: fluoride efflux transporter CrcB [Sphingopyxis sp.]